MDNSSRKSADDRGSWWSKRTGMEKGLCVVVIVFVFLIIGLGLGIAVTILHFLGFLDVTKGHELSTYTVEGSMCLTPECVKSAGNMLEMMNTSTSACDDFYQFVCGKQDEKMKSIQNDSELFSTIMMSESLTLQLPNLLEEPSRAGEPEWLRKSKLFYRSCTNVEHREDVDMKPLIDLLENFGGWPVLKGDSWNEDRFDWQYTLRELRKFGLKADYIFNVDIELDTLNTVDESKQRFNLLLEPPYFVVNMLINHTQMVGRRARKYLNYMTDVAIMLGGNKDDVEVEMAAVQRIETNLNALTMGRTDTKRAYVGSLHNISGSVSWREMMNAYLPFEIEDVDVIKVDNPLYIGQAIQAMELGRRRDVANYMLWKAVAETIGLLSEKFEVLQERYRGKYGIGRSPKRIRCLRMLVKSVPEWGMSLIRYDVKRRFLTTEASEQVLDVKKFVAKELEPGIYHAAKNSRRQYARNNEQTEEEKLNIWKDKLILQGMDDKIQDDHFSDLTINELDFFYNVLYARRFQRNLVLNKVRERDQTFPTAESASYRPLVLVPLLDLIQLSTLQVGVPHYLNYGSVGSFSAVSGLMFSLDREQLNLVMDDTRMFKYKSKSQCDKISDDQEHRGVMKPIFSLGYKAYKEWTRTHGQEPTLPGLQSFTPDQLFWIKRFQTICHSDFYDYINLHVNKERLNAEVKEIPELTNDFYCPYGAPMNPSCITSTT